LALTALVGRKRLAHDDRARNENWFTYGEEVLSVADGTVLATKDGIPDNVPLSEKRAVPITLDTLGGNMVVVDIGNGRYGRVMRRAYAIFSSFIALPPRIASLSALLRNFALSTKSTPTGQSNG